MDNKEHELTAELENLLNSKEFHELTDNEIEIVLKTMTQSEYHVLRNTIKQTIEYFKTESLEYDLNQELESKLLTHFQDKKVHLLRTLFSYKIPVYQAVAVTILILTLFFYRDDNIITKKEYIIKPQFITKTDTISIEKIKIKYLRLFEAKLEESINIKQSQSEANTQSDKNSLITNEQNGLLENDLINYYLSITQNNINLIDNKKLGSSLADDSVLAKFLVTAR